MTVFKLEKRPDQTGTTIDTLVKYEGEPKEGQTGEEWCNVQELDCLFDTATRRWGQGNWDLEKVLTAIREAEFD